MNDRYNARSFLRAIYGPSHSEGELDRDEVDQQPIIRDSFVPMPGVQNGHAVGIRINKQMYKCGWWLQKAHGTLNHLDARFYDAIHGAKRTPEGMLLFHPQARSP
jgi:hypothetical protein